MNFVLIEGLNLRSSQKTLESNEPHWVILDDINDTMDVEDQMILIMQALSDTVAPIPEAGSYTLFIMLKLLGLIMINTLL